MLEFDLVCTCMVQSWKYGSAGPIYKVKASVDSFFIELSTAICVITPSQSRDIHDRDLLQTLGGL